MKKNLLFTSAGDNSNFYDFWLDDIRNYDICIYYYGNCNYDKYKEYSDYYFKGKGGKFQNFYKLWINESFIKNYDRYFIVDDDIIISTNDINILFEYAEYLNTWILQPSFDSNNKNCVISHNITKHNSNYLYRYVNFIEVNTMLFSKYALDKCMEIYDNSLVGFGIDWLFLWYLGKDNKNKFAIIDTVTCINPMNKNINKREIEQLQSNEKRFENFQKILKKYNFNTWEHKNYSGIKIITK